MLCIDITLHVFCGEHYTKRPYTLDRTPSLGSLPIQPWPNKQIHSKREGVIRLCVFLSGELESNVKEYIQQCDIILDNQKINYARE